MNTKTTLEQQFADLIRTHGLASISLSVFRHAHSEGLSIYAIAHAANGDDQLCGANVPGAMSIAEAIAEAISGLNAMRDTAVTVELPPMGEVA